MAEHRHTCTVEGNVVHPTCVCACGAVRFAPKEEWVGGGLTGEAVKLQQLDRERGVRRDERMHVLDEVLREMREPLTLADARKLRDRLTSESMELRRKACPPGFF